MKFLRRLFLIFVATLAFTSNAGATESLMNQIHSLEPIIGGFPPNIKSEEDANSVKKSYAQIKSELDALLVAHPQDQDLLFMRGHLQSMGHNLDLPDAYQGATDDLKALLTANPAHIPGMLELAELWVNSNPALAPNAEVLFRAAQCSKGNEPLEEAQSGLFFAFYYQGKMNDALRQSEYLKQTWPQEERYQRLNKMVQSVLARSGKTKALPPTKSSMTTCKE